jgi:hypothetical protein
MILRWNIDFMILQEQKQLAGHRGPESAAVPAKRVIP